MIPTYLQNITVDEIYAEVFAGYEREAAEIKKEIDAKIDLMLIKNKGI